MRPNTGWTEPQAIQNKAEVWTFEALKAVRQRLPFPVLGIDSDNGGEFINAHLLRYCQEEQITFTRSRAYRKNDSCYGAHLVVGLGGALIMHWRPSTR
jgi:hypothetical protein